MADDNSNNKADADTRRRILESLKDDGFAQSGPANPSAPQQSGTAPSPVPDTTETGIKEKSLLDRVDEEGAGAVLKDGARSALGLLGKGLLKAGEVVARGAGDLARDGYRGAPIKWGNDIKDAASPVTDKVDGLVDRIKQSYQGAKSDVETRGEGKVTPAVIAGYTVERVVGTVHNGVKNVLENVVGDPAVTYAADSDLSTKYGMIGSDSTVQKPLTREQAKNCKKFLKAMEGSLKDRNYEALREPIASELVRYACTNMDELKTAIGGKDTIVKSILDKL